MRLWHLAALLVLASLLPPVLKAALVLPAQLVPLGLLVLPVPLVLLAVLVLLEAQAHREIQAARDHRDTMRTVRPAGREMQDAATNQAPIQDTGEDHRGKARSKEN